MYELYENCKNKLRPINHFYFTLPIYMDTIEKHEIKSLEQLRQSKIDERNAKLNRKGIRGRPSKREKLIVANEKPIVDTKKEVRQIIKKRSKTRFVTISLVMHFD